MFFDFIIVKKMNALGIYDVKGIQRFALPFYDSVHPASDTVIALVVSGSRVSAGR